MVGCISARELCRGSLGTLSLAVDESGRHCYCIAGLKESLRFHSDNIILEEIHALNGSMPRRVVALITRKENLRSIKRN